MKLADLYNEYLVLADKTDNNIWDDVVALYDEKIKVNRLSVDEIIGAIRQIRDGCMVEHNGVEIVDYSLLEIAMEVGIVSIMTDIDIDGNAEAYAMINNMMLMDYLRNVGPSVVELIQKFQIYEEKNYQHQNSPQIIIKKNMELISSSIAKATDAFVDAVQNFDPSQIDVAQDILMKFNDGVKEVSKITNIKNV